MKQDKKLSVNEILEEKIERVQRRREWRRFLTECLIVAAAVYLVFHYVIGLAFVSGSSMEPSLRDGELVVFYRLDKAYHADDLVIIHMDENLEYIKRIVAEPGDTVDLTEDGKLLVNGEQEEDRLVIGETKAVPDGTAFPCTVPEGCYFVLGDNRENSKDSRSFGAVRQEDITGRVFVHLGMTQ